MSILRWLNIQVSIVGVAPSQQTTFYFWPLPCELMRGAPMLQQCILRHCCHVDALQFGGFQSLRSVAIVTSGGFGGLHPMHAQHPCCTERMLRGGAPARVSTHMRDGHKGFEAPWVMGPAPGACTEPRAGRHACTPHACARGCRHCQSRRSRAA